MLLKIDQIPTNIFARYQIVPYVLLLFLAFSCQNNKTSDLEQQGHTFVQVCDRTNTLDTIWTVVVQSAGKTTGLAVMSDFTGIDSTLITTKDNFVAPVNLGQICLNSTRANLKTLILADHIPEGTIVPVIPIAITTTKERTSNTDEWREHKYLWCMSLDSTYPVNTCTNFAGLQTTCQPYYNHVNQWLSYRKGLNTCRIERVEDEQFIAHNINTLLD